MIKKNILRKQAKELRKTLDIDSRSKILCQKLKDSEFYISSKRILIYYPTADEVNLLGLLNDCSKQFYLPRVNDDMLECCEYKSGDKLKLSKYNILEPICQPCSKNIIDLAVIPALMCDKKKFRLGYGGGYYDKFLTNFNGKTVVCIPSELIIDELPINNYDISMDFVIVA